jgi:hypothetical protein
MKGMEQKMKRTVIVVIGLLVLCLFTHAYAQETTPIAVPSAITKYLYSVQVGKHVYYMPNNHLEVMGYDFSNKRQWSADTYASLSVPMANLTYTHSPEGIYEIDGAMLLCKSHRGDLELKPPRFLIHPTATLEWSAMDLHTWKMAEVETPVNDKDGLATLDKDGKPVTTKSMVLVHNRDSFQRIYGGAGLAFEYPVTDAFTFKTTGTYRFINQRGWEGSAGMSWTPGKLVKGEPRVMLGVTGHEAYYSWGTSRNLGVMAEFGISF